MAVKNQKRNAKCEECRVKHDVGVAHVAAITKLLDRENNLLLTRTVTTTEEYRSDLGAALVVAFASGQLPIDLLGVAIETVANFLEVKRGRDSPAD